MIDEINNAIIRFQDSIQKKIAPVGYFNKNIFRGGFLILALLVAVDMYFNDWELQTVRVECPSTATQPCINPFHLCSAKPLMNTMQSFSKESLILYQLQDTCLEYNQLPKQIQKDGFGEQYYMQPGEIYGRNDILARHGNLFMFSIILAMFGFNHLYYRKYVRKV